METELLNELRRSANEHGLSIITDDDVFYRFIEIEKRETRAERRRRNRKAS